MNQMELSFNARIENEPFARTSVASFITSLNPTIDELVEIKTIISMINEKCSLTIGIFPKK